MKILYKNKDVEKQFSSAYQNKWKYPKKVEEKLLAMENMLIAADSLKDIVRYPPARFHKLKGDRQHEWSISLGNTGYRITLIPYNDENQPFVFSDFFSECHLIKIVSITEVSNHYE